MSYKTVRSIYKDLCEIEIEILRNNPMNATEAKKHLDNVISLHIKFIENQMHLTAKPHHNKDDACFEDIIENGDAYDYDKGDYPSLFDEVQSKAIELRRKLKKISQLPLNEPTTSSNSQMANPQQPQSHLASTKNSATILQKRNMYIAMIESFKWDENINLEEAKVLINYLRRIYDSFSWHHESLVLTVKTDDELEQHYKIFQDTLLKVISLENKLIKIQTKPVSTGQTKLDIFDETKESASIAVNVSYSSLTLIMLIILIVFFLIGWNMITGH